MLIEPSDWPVVRSITDGIPNPSAAIRPVRQRLDRRGDPLEQLRLRAGRRRHLVTVEHRSVRVDRAGEDLRAAEIDADDSLSAHGPRLPYPAGWRTERSPTGSTRAAGREGRVPTRTPSGAGNSRATAAARSRRAARAGAGGSGSRSADLRRAARRLDVASYLSFRAGVEDANARLPKAVKRGPRAAGRRARLEAVADPAARHRRRPHRRARRRTPLRLDPARPHRPGPAPARVPLDPARPPRRHPGPRAEQDQRRLPARRARRWR